MKKGLVFESVAHYFFIQMPQSTSKKFPPPRHGRRKNQPHQSRHAQHLFGCDIKRYLVRALNSHEVLFAHELDIRMTRKSGNTEAQKITLSGWQEITFYKFVCEFN